MKLCKSTLTLICLHHLFKGRMERRENGKEFYSCSTVRMGHQDKYKRKLAHPKFIFFEIIFLEVGFRMICRYFKKSA